MRQSISNYVFMILIGALLSGCGAAIRALPKLRSKRQRRLSTLRKAKRANICPARSPRSNLSSPP